MLKKYSLSQLFVFLIVVALTACSQDLFIDESVSVRHNLTLSLSCGESASRAAAAEKVVDFNENKIEKLDCFFYPSSATAGEQATHHLTLSGLEANAQAVVHTALSEEKIQALFGTDATECQIYVIANLPEGVSIDPDKTSINELKKLEVSASFIQNADAQPSFVMDSELGTEGKTVAKVTYDRTTKQLSGTVPLVRTASKITLTITEVKDEITDQQDVTWKPVKEGMQVVLRQGLSGSYLDSKQNVNEPSLTSYFDFSFDKAITYQTVEKDANGTKTTVYEQKLPFYSFAKDWSVNAEHETYLVLVVPWQQTKDQTKFKTCYYQIPVNSKLKNLVRNQYYNINLKVSAFGSTIPTIPVKVAPSYTILDWSTQQIDAKLADYHYLVVSPTKYIMENQNELEIPYSSSRDIEFVQGSITCTRTNLSANLAEEEKVTLSHSNSNESTNNLYIDKEHHQIIYHKDLVNDFLDDRFDFTPYKLKFTVQHIGHPEFKEEVEIVQYPAVYAEYEQNSDVENTTNLADASNNDNRGYVIVNGYQSKWTQGSGLKRFYYTYDTKQTVDDRDIFGTAQGVEGMTHEQITPNRYIFTVTSVKGTNYIIGDPRVKEPSEKLTENLKPVYFNTGANDAWTSAPSTDEGGLERRLQNYYPTDDSKEASRVIAPKFMIASSYGAIWTEGGDEGGAPYDLDGMVKRCASYQEEGYPAGRWRVPTKAEFEFILQLVNRNAVYDDTYQVKGNKLPPIYVLDKQYWCANGIGTPSKDGNGKTYVDMQYKTSDGVGHSVRCVYDLWYWGDKDKCDKTKFTWGDRPR